VRAVARFDLIILRDKAVLVGRPFPPMNDWLRVTIGTRPQTKLAPSR
jgi:hypothetical protein